MKSFRGMTALVTGASSGIGEAFAKQLAAEGAHLILVARSQDRLEILAKNLQQQYSIQASVIVSDLSRENAPYEIHDAVKARGLTVDLLINNAGFGRRGDFQDADAKTDQEMLAVNVTSMVALAHLFLPEMVSRKKGGIINIGSTAAFQPLPHLTLYAATKAFVLNFTEGLWGEYLGKGVRIFCLCPGNTRTEFHERAKIQPQLVFLAAQADAVVRYGLNIFQKTNRPFAVYGFLNALLAQGYRFAPRSWVTAIAGMIYRARSR